MLKSQLRNIPWKIFDENEVNLLDLNFNKLSESAGSINIDKFAHSLFFNLPIHQENILSFIKDFYKKQNVECLITNVEQKDFYALSYLLTKAYKNEEDANYYKKSLFFVIYDIIQGQIGSFDKNNFDFKIINMIFNFVVHIFIDRHDNKQDLILKFDEDKLQEILSKQLLSKGEVDKSLLLDFLNKLENFDLFVKNHFHLKFMGIEYDSSLMTSIPLLTDCQGFLRVESYLLFCLSNSLIYFKEHAFKLFDSSKDGKSVSSAVYSFLGFGGSVAIFLHHFDKEENKEYVLGAFIHSNLKECRETQHCGDELSYIFFIYPQFRMYKFVENANKVAYLAYKDVPPYDKKPGIGMGDYKDKFRLWVDAKEMSGESYFLKFDDVFEEGSPFEDAQKYLNIMNIEIFGFGDKDDFNEFVKKQEKDKVYFEKGKQINKQMFAESQFDKDFMLSETFSHQKYGKTSNLETS